MTTQLQLFPPPSRGSLDEARRWEARARQAIDELVAYTSRTAGEMRAPTDEEIAAHRGRWRCVSRGDDEMPIARDMMTGDEARAWRETFGPTRVRAWRWWPLTREGAPDLWPVT